MAYTTLIRVTHNEPKESFGTMTKLSGMDSSRPREAAVALAAYFEAVAAGVKTCTLEVGVGGTAVNRASGTITLGAISGNVGATIGGTLVTVATTGGAAGTIGPLIAKINADPVVSTKVFAVQTAAAVITLYAVSPTNLVTLALSGTGVTVSGAALAGGAHDNAVPQFYTRS